MNINTAMSIMEALNLALRFASDLEAILKKDPDVWKQVSGNFNQSVEDFNNALNSRSQTVVQNDVQSNLCLDCGSVRDSESMGRDFCSNCSR